MLNHKEYFEAMLAGKQVVLSNGVIIKLNNKGYVIDNDGDAVTLCVSDLATAVVISASKQMIMDLKALKILDGVCYLEDNTPAVEFIVNSDHILEVSWHNSSNNTSGVIISRKITNDGLLIWDQHTCIESKYVTGYKIFKQVEYC
jgi:hypothetical protein